MPQFTTKRRVHHSAADMFDLVADMREVSANSCRCARDLRIKSRTEKATDISVVVANMTVAYKMIQQTFTSRVTLDRPNLKIVVEYLDGPFSRCKTSGPSGRPARNLRGRVLHRLRIPEPHAGDAHGRDVRHGVPQVRRRLRGARRQSLRPQERMNTTIFIADKTRPQHRDSLAFFGALALLYAVILLTKFSLWNANVLQSDWTYYNNLFWNVNYRDLWLFSYDRFMVARLSELSQRGISRRLLLLFAFVYQHMPWPEAFLLAVHGASPMLAAIGIRAIGMRVLNDERLATVIALTFALDPGILWPTIGSDLRLSTRLPAADLRGARRLRARHPPRWAGYCGPAPRLRDQRECAGLWCDRRCLPDPSLLIAAGLVFGPSVYRSSSS